VKSDEVCSLVNHSFEGRSKDDFTEQFREKIPNITNPEFNRHIKTIGKLASIDQLIKFSYKKGSKSISITNQKFDWITSHTARRSFCTNEFLADTPVKLIMKINGHKNEKDFYRYMSITPEEAAQKIKGTVAGQRQPGVKTRRSGRERVPRLKKLWLRSRGISS
jgi:hypothetical protein